jgi:hypothetical protein
MKPGKASVAMKQKNNFRGLLATFEFHGYSTEFDESCNKSTKNKAKKRTILNQQVVTN